MTTQALTPLQYQLANVPMLGKGMILIDRLNALGQITGLQPVGNVTKFSIEPKDDIAELYGSMNASSSLLATALKKRDIKVSLTGTDFKDDVMALAMMSAGKTTLSISAATVTSETLVPVSGKHAGRYYRTLQRNVDNAGTPPVVTNNSVVLTVNTDYVLVDPASGLFYFPPGTAAVDGDATTVTYHTLAGSFSQVAGGTVPRIQSRIVFQPDPTDGQKIGLEIWKVNLSPSGSLEMIADDYGNWQLEGLVLDDTVNHPTVPLYGATFYQ